MSLLLGCMAQGQYFMTGDDPLDMRLWQIKSAKYRIIYDEPMSQWAKTLSHVMDSVAVRVPATLGHSPRRVDVLLHSRHAYSNGLVSWAPSRLEMYTFSSRDGDCIPWMHHLALHEYRHVVQTSMINKGFTRFLHGIFGEQIDGAVLGLYVPLWFLEGDAVVTETSLSNGGRGRKASFLQGMRALALTGNAPKYDCAYNGSYRHYYPDYYTMGYLTVSNARLKYGTDVWRDAMELVGRRSWSVNPFSRSLRRSTGKGKVDLYDEAMADWTRRWQHQDSMIVATPYDVLSSHHCDYCDYLSPIITDKGIVAYKTCPETIPAIILISSDGAERVLAYPSPRNEANLTVHGDTVLWCERHPHVRWENASASVVMGFDISSGRKFPYLSDGVYSLPSISPDGKRMAVLNIDRSARTSIEIRNFPTRNVEQSLYIEGEVTSLSWHGNDGLAYVRLTGSGKSIEIMDLAGNVRTVISSAYHNIKHLVSDGRNLYFSDDESGIDNIVKVDEFGSCSHVTSSRFGAAWPCVSGNDIVYSDYSPSGYQIVRATIPDSISLPNVCSSFLVADSLRMQEGGVVSFPDEIESVSQATPRRYRRISHLFRFHSWGPVSIDADAMTISPGIAISSQNTLGTSVLTAGYRVLNSESHERLYVNYSYSGLYPKLALSCSTGYYDYKFDGAYLNAEKTSGVRVYYDDRQKVSDIKCTATLPLNFSRGAWLSGMNIVASVDRRYESSFTYYTQTVTGNGDDLFLSRDVISHAYESSLYAFAEYRVGGYLIRRPSSRDAGYRYGVSLDVGQKSSLFGRDYGQCSYLSATLYLPGIMKHHGISILFQTQAKTVGEERTTIDGRQYRCLMSDAIGVPRLTTRVRNDIMSLLRFNYTLPIANPNWSLGGLLFVKRILLRPFYDVAWGRTSPFSNESSSSHFNVSSVGSDLWMESHWLRLPYRVSLGYRYAYLAEDETTSGSVILGIKLSK